jgi:hypothetical protein
MTGKQGRKWRGSIALLVVLVAWVFTHPPHEPLLHELATHVASCRHWNHFYGTTFLWLSNHELLYSEEQGPSHRLGLGHSMLIRHDILTQQNTPLPALNKIWFDSANCLDCGHYETQVSPDGKMLLWEQGGGGSSLWTATLDSALPRNTVENDTSSFFAWLPDSRHWIELHQNPKTRLLDTARIHDAYHPHDISVRPVAPIQTNGANSERSAPAVNLIVDSTGNMNAFPSDFIYAKAILHVDILSDPIQQSQVPLKFPWAYSEIMEWVSSPDGDRIACMVQSQGQSGFVGWLRKHVPFLTIKQGVVWQLWVCRWDGSNPQQIGCAEPQAGLPLDKQRPGFLTWLPDGKMLSFISREELYTVPIP